MLFNSFMVFKNAFSKSILYSLSGQSRIIRLPVNQIHTINKISKATQEFEKKYERTPSYLELEKLTDIQADKIDSIINSNNRIVSVDAPFKSEEEGTLIDVIQNYNSPKADLNLIKDSEDKNIERGFLIGIVIFLIVIFSCF